jgi:PPOX class probable F420-dependent enzyme
MLDLTNERHAHIAERLRTNSIVWLTSVRPDGRPHSVAVWFYWDGTTFLMFSRPNNQKLLNIQHNSKVLIIVDDSKEGSDPITIEGNAELVENLALEQIPEYIAKYSERIARMKWTPESMAADYSQAIRITPTRFM